jgi:hypothetical protein
MPIESNTKQIDIEAEGRKIAFWQQMDVECQKISFRQQIFSSTQNLVGEAEKEREDSGCKVELTDNKERTEMIMANLKVIKLFLGRGWDCDEKKSKEDQVGFVAGNIIKFGGEFDDDLDRFIINTTGLCSKPYIGVANALQYRIHDVKNVSKEEKERLMKAWWFVEHRIGA